MSCKSCNKARTSGGGPQPHSINRGSVYANSPNMMNINAVSELRNPPKRDIYTSQANIGPFLRPRPREIAGSDLAAYYAPHAGMKKCMEFRPAACISAMPCDEKFLNTKLPDGNTYRYYLLRNRIASDQTNKLPYYNTWDQSIMWTTPNDYKF